MAALVKCLIPPYVTSVDHDTKRFLLRGIIWCTLLLLTGITIFGVVAMEKEEKSFTFGEGENEWYISHSSDLVYADFCNFFVFVGFQR